MVLNDAALMNMPNGIQVIIITKQTFTMFVPLKKETCLPEMPERIWLNNPFSDKRYCHEKTLTDSFAKKGSVIRMKKND